MPGLVGSCWAHGLMLNFGVYSSPPGSDFGKRLHYFWVGLSVSGITKAPHNMGSTGPDLKCFSLITHSLEGSKPQ